MSRFNFTNITRESVADILDVMGNFDLIEANGLILDDLPKMASITLKSDNWVTSGEYYEYTISNSLIQVEPYNISVIFNDLTKILSPIYAKADSQASGSIILQTKTKPSVDLSAKLIVTKGVNG